MRRLTLDYLRTESGSGLVLAASAVAAIGLANSRIASDYFGLLATPVPVRIGDFAQTLSAAGWVRALLMPVFFLVLGMELKFELLRGELSNPRRIALPALAALGGLAAPFLVYLAASRGACAGWGAGAATDGATALAALAITGPRLAHSLRVLLVSVAIADNLAAVILTAAFQARALDEAMLVGAAVVLALLVLLSRWRRAPFFFYAAGFGLVWGFTLKSGLDPALAGIACALTVPIGARRIGQESTLKYFMESLHPYVAFVVLPLFVFTAAGVVFRQLRPQDLTAPAPLGVMLALAVGKPLGVFGVYAAAVSFKLARRPIGVKWREMLGVALLSGVGFTTSYFVAGMGSENGAPGAVRVAVLIGSMAAALAGGWLLASTEPQRAVASEELV